MFDVQVRRHREADLPEDVLASIAGYYRRVTTTARPMNRLVGAAMLGTIRATVAGGGSGHGGGAEAGAAWVSRALVVSAVSIAATRPVPSAVRLGSRRDPPEDQSRLARR